MRKATIGVLGLTLALAGSVAPAPVDAQAVYVPAARHAKKGPSFCRNGRGHPVHGWRWCARRGWAVNHYRPVRARAYPAGIWASVRWDGVWLDAGYAPGYYDHTVPLRSWIGRSATRRIRQHARWLGLHGRLSGHWLETRYGGVAVEVRAGPIPVARLIDRERDGHAEVLLLRRAR
jgi:hypothetical protein